MLAPHRAKDLGETYGLESSEDCRSAGRHGNQHVRLRGAQIDRIEAICPAPEATSCFEPRQASIEPDSTSRFDGPAFKTAAWTAASIPTRRPGSMAPASPKTLFGQGWPRARRAVSDFFRIKKVKLCAAIRKVGKIPSRCLAFGRRQAGLKRVSRVKIERGHKVNPARPGGSSDRAHTDVLFLQTGNFLCERNVNRRIMLVEGFGVFRILVKDDNFCHSISPSAGDLLR